MSDLPPDIPKDDDALAAEYALRLLDGQAAETAARRVAQEPAFAARVRDWEARLSVLAEDLDPVEPPARLRARIMADTGTGAARSRRWWLGAGLGLATLTALAVMLVPTMLQPPAYRADLASADGALRLSASVSDGDLRITRIQGGPRPDRTLELWLIAEEAPAPVSLGVLPEAQTADIALPPALVERIPGATLAVSDEPPGGSPTGAPTGEVLAAAPLVAL